MKPDTELARQKEQAEKTAWQQSNLNLRKVKNRPLSMAEALKQRQEMEEDLEILPKVVEDIPSEISYAQSSQ